MSGAVGSMPSLTRSGRSWRELALEPALGQAIDGVSGQPGRALRRRHAALSAAVEDRETIRRNARLSPPPERRRPCLRGLSVPFQPITGPPSPAGPRAAPRRHRSHERRRTTPHPGRSVHAGRSRSARRARRWRRDRDGQPAKPRLRKLRLLSILVGLGVLAMISTVFGMMMAVASDLPQLENRQQYRQEANSFLYDDRWRPIGIFAPPNHVVIDTFGQISPSMKDAIVVDRGQALLERPRRRHPRHRPRLGCRRQRRRHAGRLDDRPAVRQERPRRAEQPDGPREAARGGAGLPSHPQVEEEADPHRVPELDLLRQRRLRRRVGGPGVLRQDPRLQSERGQQRNRQRLRGQHPVGPPPDVRLGAGPVGGGPAGRHGRQPVGV